MRERPRWGAAWGAPAETPGNDGCLHRLPLPSPGPFRKEWGGPGVLLKGPGGGLKGPRGGLKRPAGPFKILKNPKKSF